MLMAKVVVYSQGVPNLVTVPLHLWTDALNEKKAIKSLEYYSFSYRSGFLKSFNLLVDFIQSTYQIKIDIWQGLRKLKQSENV